MRKTLRVLWKILKWLLIVLAVLVALVFLIAKVPAVQQFIVDRGAAYFNDKTGGELVIGDISLNLPFHAGIEEVSLKDPDGVEIAYVGEIDVHLGWRYAWKKTLRIDDFSLADVRARVLIDSEGRANYDFIVDGFSDSTATAPPPDSTAKPGWDVSIGDVELSNIKALYADATSGDSIDVDLGSLMVDMDEFSLNDQTYIADEITLKNTRGYARLAPTAADTTAAKPAAAEETTPMRLGVDDIRLENIDLTYAEAGTANRYAVMLGSLDLEVDRLDMDEMEYEVERLALADTEVDITMEPAPPDTTAQGPIDPFVPMNVSLDELSLSAVNFRMETAGRPEETLALTLPRLAVENIEVSPDRYALDLRELRGSYDEFDRLENLKAQVELTRSSAKISDLMLRYGNSRVDLDVTASYENLNAFIEKQAVDHAEIDIREIYVPPSDVAHFKNVLDIPDTAFTLPRSPVRLEADATARGSTWTVNDLKLTTGETSLTARLEAAGGDWANKTYRIDQFNLRLNRRDVLPYLATAGVDTAMVPPETNLIVNGVYGPGGTDVDGDLRTTYGDVSLMAKGAPTDTAQYPMTVSLKSRGFQFGELLATADTLAADFDLELEVAMPIDTSGIKASIVLNTDTLVYGGNAVRNIHLDGYYGLDTARATLAVQDTFVVADLNLFAHLGDTLQAEVNGDVSGIDFQGLDLTHDDLRGQLQLAATYVQYGKTQKGQVRVDDMLFVRGPERIDLTPIEGRFVLCPDSSMVSLESPFADLYSVSNRSMGEVSRAIANLVGSSKETAVDSAAYWKVDFTSKDAEALQELFLPALKTFEPATARVRFHAGEKRFDANMNFPKIEYGSFEIDSLNLSSDVDEGTVYADLYIERAAMDTLALEKVSLQTANTAKGTHVTFEIGTDSLPRHYHIEADLASEDGLENGFRVELADTILLNGKRWNVDPDNNFTQSPDGVELNKVRIHRNGRSIAFDKRPEESSTRMTANDFPLAALSGIIGTEKELLTGSLYGELKLNANGSFAGSGRIEDFMVSRADMGRLTWQADKGEESFHVNIATDGDAMAFEVSGDIRPQSATESALDLTFQLDRLSLDALPALAPSMIGSGEGKLTGGVDITGTTSAPQLKGELVFREARLQLQGNDAVYRFGDEKIDIQPKSIDFNRFTVRDSAGQQLVIDGKITHENFSHMRADLSVQSDEFEFLDLRPGSNELLYGNLTADLDIEVTGRLDAPDVEADIAISPKTDLTFIVPESDYDESFDESLVEWTDFDQKEGNEILTRDKDEGEKTPDIFANTVRLTGSLRIDPKAEFRVVIDSLAGDYLMIRGSGELGITYDRLGNIRLNGSYEVADGFYQLTFYNLVKRKFLFEKGSRLTWNGAPTNATLDITAIYETRTSIANLMGSGGASSGATFKTQLPFEVLMNISGELMEPEIAFDIELADEAKGALGGAVGAKLTQLRQNESDLNKQVFALLVLNTFLGDAGGGDNNFLAGQARNSASSILTQQLNRLSDQLISGVDINFDLQSYGGAAGEGNTDLSVDIAKSFADDRVIVRVGSTIALEQNNAAGQQSQEMMTNVVVEYKITPDGRYRFKVFRENNLEDIVVGRITRTGAGLLFQRDFDRFNVLFRKADEEKEAPNDENSQDANDQNPGTE